MGSWFGRRQSVQQPLNPFVPGQGALPPFLAGRGARQALIRERLNRLGSGAATGSFVVLHAPRGNGKTALLEWAERRAESRKIRVIDIDPGDAEDSETEIGDGSRLFQWLRSVGSFSIRWMSVNCREVPPSKLTAAIRRRARRGPAPAAIDEAHTMPVKMGRTLLTAAQRWQRGRSKSWLWNRRSPRVLLLAGTPDLRAHLQTMGASLWERSKKPAIGRLGPNASAEAIRVPLAEFGRSIAEDAMERIAEESRGYPFFPQLWGELLWREWGDGGRPLTRSDVDRLRPRFEDERDDLYLDRYRELSKAKLIPVAESAAAAFKRSDWRPADEVVRAAQEGLEVRNRIADQAAAAGACTQLRKRGFICPTVKEFTRYYEPGIPSLMRFVLVNKIERMGREQCRPAATA